MPYLPLYMAAREFAPGRSPFTTAADKSQPSGKGSPGVGKHSLPSLEQNVFVPKVVDYAAFLADKDDEGAQTIIGFAKAATVQAATDYFAERRENEFTINLKRLIDVDGKGGLPLPSKKHWQEQIGEHKIGLEAKAQFIPAEQRMKITMFLRVVPQTLPQRNSQIHTASNRHARN